MLSRRKMHAVLRPRSYCGNPNLVPDAPTPITAQTHETALRIGEQYRYGIYDALIAAAALEAGCVTLYSEDFQDGQIIDGQLTIRNPFK
jgi:hypothetical protein